VQEADLAFFTTQELVDELMRRKTFLGVVVRSENEIRNGQWGDERIFKVQFNENLDSTQVSRLLDVVVDYLNRNSC
jgi:hypothetical protein